MGDGGIVEKALIFSDLVKRFGSVVALNLEGQEVTVKKGEILAVIGPSGSGKTTLLRSIAGLEVPDKGYIEINGIQVFNSVKGINMPPEKREIGYVPQTWGLWPHMKVWDNIAFGLKIRKVPPKIIEDKVTSVARALRIEELLNRYPWQLSGGQQQRVAVARALVVEPSLLLLDEPISNLDAALRDEARVWLRSTIKSLGITSLYVTHDIREAFVLGDRVAVLFKGSLIKIGAPREIYEEPNSRVIVELLGYNLLKGRVSKISEDHVEVDLGGSSIACRALERLWKGDETLVIISPRDIIIGEGDIDARVLGGSYTGDRYETYIEALSHTLKVSLDREPATGPVKIKIRKCLTIRSQGS